MSRLASRTLLIAAAAAMVGACGLGGGATNNPAANEGAADTNQLRSSEYDVVLAMLELADVQPDELVADLGSGDGRIPILAAREKGARGLGVEIDPARIRQSNENAAAAGVADRVQFRQEDLFVTPLNDVSVLTLFLLPEINLQLRPKILAQMKPGARVVSNTWDMGDWRPDQQRTVGGSTIYMWVVPARVAGRYRFEADGAPPGEFVLEQRYQEVTGRLANGRPITDGRLHGDQISFTADLGNGPRRYEGRIVDGGLQGNGWRASMIGG